MSAKFLQVAIIDYGMGNLFSVKQACECVGLNPVITADKSVIESSNGLILPGVGAFGDAMDSLRKLGLVSLIRDFVASGRPFFGICLGLQLLMEESEEFGMHKGIGIIKGRVKRFPEIDALGKRNKVPQVGWNRIIKNLKGDWVNTPLSGTKDGEFMYFVHSFYAQPEESDSVIAKTKYGNTEYCSCLLQKNIFAVQFHPEKSSLEGIKIYQNWADRLNN